MALPKTMAAAVLTGHGGLDKLDYRTDVPLPRPQPGEVLIEVAASAINNTDINTRIGWYSKAVDSGTNDARETHAVHSDWSDAEQVLAQGADQILDGAPTS